MLHKAYEIAVRAHAGQDRDGEAPLPYISHPFDVLNRLRYVGGETDPEVLCAALLHDVIEESSVPISEIRETLGERVAKLVEELTREEPHESIRAEHTYETWYELRNQLLLEGIRKMSADAMKVKLADRCSNLENAFATRSGKKLKRYVKQSEEILKIVPRSVCPPLWDVIKRLIG